MNKTLRTSFKLKNTYKVNAILYCLKQIPFIKKLLPASLYQARGLKIFANVLAVLWEIIATFAGKILYFSTLVCGIGMLYESLPRNEIFLHILFFLSVVGIFANTSLLKPSKDKYYAMMLMRMDANEYTKANYLYYSLRVIVGFLPCTLLFGLSGGVPLWICLVLPFCIAGMKAFFIGLTLVVYKKTGQVFNENRLSGTNWLSMGILLIAAYGLTALGIAIPATVSTALFLLGIPLGAFGFYKILTYNEYYTLNRELLISFVTGIATPEMVAKQASEKRIMDDVTITSNKKGFEYLNELFIKRHRGSLWKVTKTISCVSLAFFAVVQLAMALLPELKGTLNGVVMSSLPYFLFVMYMINRGTSFTQSLFMNCDHSLLTYAFFKKPSFILKLFVIRLREIMKINAVPALIIGAGLALTLYTSGGTDTPINYAVIIVSVLCMSLFFSLHYLTMYYLLQPYNAGTQLKSGTYRIVSFITYFGCYMLMQQPIPTLIFGIMTIAFTVVYCIVASILVYCFAPKTFRIRL